MNHRLFISLSLSIISLLAFAQENFSFTESNNAFAIKLYHQLAKDKANENLCFSPYSLNLAMAMTYNGAKHQTKKEIQKTFSYPTTPIALNKQCLSHHNKLIENTDAVEFHSINALWMQKDYAFYPSFSETIQYTFSAKLTQVDFKKTRKRKKAIAAINAWAYDYTEGHISYLVPELAINKNTRLILSNALYFNGKWETQFDPEKNRIETFYATTGTQQVNYMRLKSKFNFYYDDLIQVLELPYCENKQSLFILLPKKNDGLALLEKTFDPFYLENILSDRNKKSVIVTIPKFKLAFDMEVSETFQAMGLQAPFTTKADFSGMTEKPELFIDKIFHKATLEISEQGTKAAAASAVVISRKSALRDTYFMADHPFMFFIRDNQSGLILFMGSVQSIEN